MSEKIWIISDTHFGHNNIIKYCARPYDNAEQMNKDIIQKWNNVVSPQDLVYHLGDFGFGSKEMITQWRRALNGHIKLIKGNHDQRSNQWYRNCGFDEVYDRPIIVQNNLILSHAPLEEMKENSGFINIHGHVHNDPRYVTTRRDLYNVSVEVINFYPILLEEIKNESM